MTTPQRAPPSVLAPRVPENHCIFLLSSAFLPLACEGHDESKLLILYYVTLGVCKSPPDLFSIREQIPLEYG